MKRKTKIIATIGPASESPKNLEAIFNAGANAFRLNLSHDGHSVQEKRVHAIRALSKKYNRPVAIIADLQGPKMRVGNLPTEGIDLHSDMKFILDTTISDYQGGNKIPLPSEAFQKGVRAGNTVFLDDGSLMLRIISGKNGKFTVQVLRGGILYSRKGVNVPDLALRTEIFEKKDRDDIAFALRMKVDYLALSFIRNADDIDFARKLVGKSPVKLIAKIERHEALSAIDEIIEGSDAIMIARGDLGIETPIWQLPKRQKEIIEKARNAMKPVIVATQMLGSMIKNAIPTRAEVNDVANAVFDSTDAVMLSAETASGTHPVEAVSMMRQIIEETEKGIIGPMPKNDNTKDVDISVARSARFIANEIHADLIAAGTVTGHTALALARFRPEKPIVAITSDERVANSLSISYGAKPVVIFGLHTIEEMEKKMIAHVKKFHSIQKGGKIVFLCGERLGEAGKTSNISVITVS